VAEPFEIVDPKRSDRRIFGFPDPQNPDLHRPEIMLASPQPVGKERILL
jgi:hypothetical protein